MASNDIIHSPLNEALQLVEGIDSLPYFEDDCYQIGMDHGAQFAGPTLGKEFDLLLAAIDYIDTVRRAHSLQSLKSLVKGLKDGRQDADVRLREADGSYEADRV